jgi:hypothetical protein
LAHVFIPDVELAELAADAGHCVVDLEAHLLADELLAEELARVEGEGLVLGGVVAPRLR